MVSFAGLATQATVHTGTSHAQLDPCHGLLQPADLERRHSLPKMESLLGVWPVASFKAPSCLCWEGTYPMLIENKEWTLSLLISVLMQRCVEVHFWGQFFNFSSQNQHSSIYLWTIYINVLNTAAPATWLFRTHHPKICDHILYTCPNSFRQFVILEMYKTSKRCASQIITYLCLSNILLF